MPISTKLTRMLMIGGAFALATIAQAQTAADLEADEKEKPWEEVAAQLPPAPKPENLLSFYVSPTASQTFAVDAQSISVGEDGVVRYTLVSTSAAGAQNVSYEGIRCQTKEMRAYAYGHKDGSWGRSRRDQWQRIVGSGANRPQAALVQDYFCESGLVTGKAEDIVKRLRKKQAHSNYDG